MARVGGGPRLQSFFEARPWIVLVLAALVSVPTIVLGEISAADTRSRLRDAQLQAQHAAAIRAANRVRFILGDVADHLAEAVRPTGPIAVALSTGNRGALQTALQDVAAQYTYTTAYFYMDAKTGIVVAGSTSRSGGTGPVARTIGSSSDNRPWVDSPDSRLGALFMTPDDLARVLKPGDIYLSDFYVPKDRSGVLMDFGVAGHNQFSRAGEERDGAIAAMVAPVKSRTGELVGALVANIANGPFIDGVFELQGITENAYLVDRKGQLVRRMEAHPPADTAPVGVLEKDWRIGDDLSSQAAVASVLRNVILGGEGIDPIEGSGALLTSAKVGDVPGAVGLNLGIGWTLIASQPLTYLYASVDAGASVLRAIRIGLVTVIMAFALLLTLSIRRIVRQRGELATANASLEVATGELAAATRHKSEFLANMSHELRTPLNAIIGFSDVLAQRFFGDLNPKQADYVGDISASGRHLLALVNEVLDLSKVEAGRMELERSDFSLAETIRAAIVFVRERAAMHAVELSADVSDDLGTAHADERKLRQVVLNLLSNAVKFTPSGGSVRVVARREDGELRVAVSDTGVGIAPEDQAKVFDEFQQVGQPSDRSREGTGLGLTLAKRFVELHGGRIWLDSGVGRGTTFTFTIPDGPAASGNR